MSAELSDYVSSGVRLRNALGYARRGFPIAPIPPGALEPSELFSLEPRDVRAYFDAEPDAGIAAEMGGFSGVFALDLTESLGLQLWADLTAEHGPCDTVAIATPSGGRQLLFKTPARGMLVDGPAFALGEGAAVIAHGGFVEMPPCPKVKEGRRFVGGAAQIAAPPPWLLSKITEGPEPLEGLADLERLAFWVDEIAGAVVGSDLPISGAAIELKLTLESGETVMLRSSAHGGERPLPIVEVAPRKGPPVAVKVDPEFLPEFVSARVCGAPVDASEVAEVVESSAAPAGATGAKVADPKRYAAGALKRARGQVARSRGVAREGTLRNAARGLGKFVADAALDARRVFERLHVAARLCGLERDLGADRVIAIIEQELRAGSTAT